MKIKFKHALLFLAFISFFTCKVNDQDKASPWPEQSNVNKPWTRWWWMGSAVDKPNIKSSLIDFHKAGIGGVEITPIYGVKGQEDNFIDYLSPKWVDMLNYTITVADSLDMQVDMVLGTGWPYGGPQVTANNAATKLLVETYEVKKDETFNKEIIAQNDKNKDIAQLLNVLAYGSDSSYVDLTSNLKGNHLEWKATNTNYTIYAVFAGKTGQQVKRAAPGGSGFTLDHYSSEALFTYTEPFNKALKGFEGRLRAIFNDSYEVYGTDFTPLFFGEFESRRGYDLRPYLPQLLDNEDTEIGNRIKSDYRETISDLLLNKFDIPWTNWAHFKNFKTKLQAHGSPGNLIDLYASADIPECETFGSMPYDIPGFRREQEDIREGDADPVMLKFSSSAAHISGKPLTSSETFTWLRDHFKTALSQCKPEVEDLFLNGINHVFLHGSTYSPKQAEWPGWKFYASVNFNPTNTIWEDVPSLFSYIANCQSMLQSGKPDNETLLYWPIYDTWGKNLGGNLFFQFKIHSLDEWLHDTPFYNTTKKLMDNGYGVDFISDNFIAQATFKDGLIMLPGGNYKSLVIPNCEKMPMATLEKLIALKKSGAPIIFEGLPNSVPGFYNYEAKNSKLSQVISENSGLLSLTSNVFKDLETAKVYPETLVKTGLKFIKRAIDGEKIYYIVNHTSQIIDDYIPLAIENKEVIILDPLTKKYGNALVKKETNATLVKLRIEPGQSFILKTENTKSYQNWNYFKASENPIELKGDWQISFEKGGPELPPSAKINTLQSWTTLSPEAEAFSGTALYTLKFNAPNVEADNWKLNLGDVRESAKVWLNGNYIGNLWSVPFSINLGQLKKGENELKVQVTNLAANRIRAKELRGEEWKIFYEINMVDKDYNKFDATKWQPMPSGLLGPISITPLKETE
ncbi:Glycosyl hydrolases family 2-2C sugar binding domain [Mariniflexile rhizosphaerae]|uniref:glycosyl hydrolase n=1 Tax=unclassified Mariniflexile TaxID=2643887 RepID=UPI000E334647|nr:glycosyl hydrolase [Mariniflexile sp. TRM1-10]AXP80163.1 Glycosyl hydrolases family 2-2C sugar binding domain [Mariniflexile sp. TRM1-10]